MVEQSTWVDWLSAHTTADNVFMHMFTDGGLLCISLTINVCTLSFFGCGRLVEFIGNKYGSKATLLTKFADLQRSKPWLWGKTITELLVTCLLITLSVIALSSTSVSRLPFTGNQTAPLDPIIQTVMSVNVGRYIYTTVQDCFLHQHLERFKTDLIHHIVTTASYTIFLAYKQNIFLSVAGLLMELNVIPIEIGRFMRDLGVLKSSALYRRTGIVSCAVTMASRGVIPVVFLAIALKHDSPLKMAFPPMILFFMCIVFFCVLNFWMILQNVSRVIKYSPCGTGDITEQSSNYQVTNQMEPQSRDIALPGTQGIRQCVTFSNLNYGYLKSYDNRNICNNVNGKNNHCSKNVSKPILVYKEPRLPPTSVGLETDDVSSNSVDVVHNNFSTRLHLQDETSRMSSAGTDLSRVSRGSVRSSSSSTSCCSTSVLIQNVMPHPQHLPEIPIATNSSISALSETADPSFTA
ncbi:uncharacterized protein LOC124137565 [Haliotis rufescens]|uniref:uncharacterized protein LOC124137565 n=1 Tax=Haliotis rufescens TaxID=6454 RepID=UPI001EB0437E|nr:uncharacterized protein LOC124137565 [Haliotis rufescens]